MVAFHEKHESKYKARCIWSGRIIECDLKARIYVPPFPQVGEMDLSFSFFLCSNLIIFFPAFWFCHFNTQDGRPSLTHIWELSIASRPIKKNVMMIGPDAMCGVYKMTIQA
jgi:hypothetical protein